MWLWDRDRRSGMIAQAWAFLLFPLFLLLVTMPTNVMAQSDFTEYNGGTLFTIGYPQLWTVDNTGIGNPDSTRIDLTHQAKFSTPFNDAFVTVTWRPVISNITLNKDNWFNTLASIGTVLSIDNQTQYVSGRDSRHRK
jgi:hypothetical protein